MIFLSHNHRDKPLVEQIALRLSDAFGRDFVFFDSWSIQPGEGIIDRMSEALAKCTHFFFFVSANSLKSKMVSLEWQNALLRTTRGACKLVPIRCDGSELPPIMAQSLYIDLYTVGLDVAIAQVADIVRGRSTYREPAKPFSNLAYTVVGDLQRATVEIRAKHFLEPIGRFLVLMENEQDDFSTTAIGEDPFQSGLNPNVRLDNGVIINGFLAAVMRGITPPMPLRVEFTTKGTAQLRIRGVLHQKSHERWEAVPLEAQSQ